MLQIIKITFTHPFSQTTYSKPCWMASPSQVLGRIFDITPLFENRNKEKKNTLYKSYILNRDKNI